jgi:hypothetical protein
MKPECVVALKESSQMLQSRRGLLWLLVYSSLLSAFSVFLMSNTELSLLDNAQVLYMMTGTLTGAGELVDRICEEDVLIVDQEATGCLYRKRMWYIKSKIRLRGRGPSSRHQDASPP